MSESAAPPADPEASPAPQPPPTLEESPPRRRRMHHAYTAEERKRILDTVLFERMPRWRARFSLMMGLSVVIASVGLLSDSTAIVIGAMLIAPLLSPIQALAVAVAMGWRERAFRYGLIVLAATGAGIGIAWLVGLIVPPTTGLPSEVLIRTSPDLRDLLVALAAGAAGAYATAREDISSALPGVAVAVALVPPLATVGVTASIGHGELAGGAMLLYVTNLVAILLAGIVVLLVTGFVPIPHLGRAQPKIVAGVGAIAVAVIIVAIPLTGGLVSATSAAQRRERIADAVASWVREIPLEVDGLEVDGTQVVVELSGPTAPPPVEPLARELERILGAGAELSVRWSQHTELRPGEVNGTVPDEQLERLREEVVEWLADQGNRHELVGVQRKGDAVILDVAGSTAPDADRLVEAMTRRGIAPAQIQLRWTNRQVLDTSTETAARDRRVRDAVDAWAAEWGGLEVLDIRHDADAVTVVARGPVEPDDADVLTAAVEAAIAGDDGEGEQEHVDVRVEFTEVRTLDAAQARRQRAERAARSWGAAHGVPVERTSLRTQGGSQGVVVGVGAPFDPALVGALADSVALVLRDFVEVTVESPGGTATAAAHPPGAVEHATAVDFSGGGASLPPEADQLLRGAVDAWRDGADDVIVVIGHSDQSGSAASKRTVSLARAQRTRDRLVELGAASEDVFVRADGGTHGRGRRADVVVGPRSAT